MNTLLFILSFIATFTGKVVDEKGNPIPYATVYPRTQPEFGTATNNEGQFSFTADLTDYSEVIISFIGYEKQTVPASILKDGNATITMHEQPIALEETVIAAKAHKQRNKRKKMAALLHAVYLKLEEEFPACRRRYRALREEAKGEIHAQSSQRYRFRRGSTPCALCDGPYEA